MNYLLVAVAYLLGTLPSAQLVAGRSGVDPTSAGSGNPGATNVYRTAGRRAGLVVFAADVGKGIAAVALGMAIAGRPLALACWVAATGAGAGASRVAARVVCVVATGSASFTTGGSATGSGSGS